MKNIPWFRTEEGRKKAFSYYGFKTLILWENELKNLSEEEIVKKIQNFYKSG
jgi:G:T-mismatch repair DNA endonuclease (very short patch repair protein)